ncbi:hypothetical protein GCM10010451_49180 [Streptomyces virens]|uniref:Translation initiation factor IF-2 n=1 Tax=Streptomyces virens TaxID=285572 RepID=A0ABP6PWT9_9ACTN|nr:MULTISPECIES: hypothetical protein [Streptomyces]MBA8975135.1 hypothetical protein [Streptomyces calvus]MYS26625.1 hypothetical protein [Streptomyces sp. SID7804]
MGEQPRRRDPKLARTDFESMTHEQLAALLDSASSEGASHLAVKLSKAASTITKIGDDLMTYTKGLEWRGEGGDAFRDWGGQTAGATLRLGEYAEVASRWMATVAQAVAEAKAALPDTSETTRAEADLADAKKSLAAAQAPDARNDLEARKLAQTAQSDAAAAQQRMEAARAEAVQQLRKLAQTYEYSAHQVNSVQPPTFSPPANHLPEREWRQPDQHVVPLPRSSPAATTFSSAGGAPQEHPGVSAPTAMSSQLNTSGGTHALGGEQPRPASMEIDSVTGVADTRSPSTHVPTPPTGTGSRPDVVHTPQPLVVPPGPAGRAGAQGSLGPQQLPQGARPPLLPGQGTPGGGRLRVPGETGIVGGRPVPPNAGRLPTGIPRGTVIGGDGQGHASRGHLPMGRSLSPGIPVSGSPTTGQNGAGGVRRLASESGGLIGNRAVQPGRTGPRPFTPGGAGLVRPPGVGDPAHGTAAGRTGGGINAPHQQVPRRDNRQEPSQRPDYLSEEEETWARRNPRAVPPVVD